MNEPGDRLVDDTLALVDIASESRDEAAILGHIRSRLAPIPGLTLVDDRDGVLAAIPARRPATPLVLLAGHVDTVPLGGAARPGRREAEAIVGRGAADMKGALAVLLALAEDGVTGPPADVGFLFFGREEIPIAESALLPALDRTPVLREAALAIVMEPTANQLEVGLYRKPERPRDGSGARRAQRTAVARRQRDPRGDRGAGADRRPADPRRRRRRPRVPRGRLRDHDRGWRCRERRPRSRGGAREFPIRADTAARAGRGEAP